MHQLQERHDMLVIGDDAVEFLEQIENDVGLPIDDGAAQLRQAVGKPQRQDFVAGSLEMRNDVVFGPPFVDFLLGGARQGLGRHEGRVHQHQRAQLFHSATRGNCRSS